MANASEKQLKCFIKTNKEVVTSFRLRPQGDFTIISSDDAIYLAEVHIPQVKGSPNVFMFGGIREKYYDKLYKKYSNDFEGVKFSSGVAEIV